MRDFDYYEIITYDERRTRTVQVDFYRTDPNNNGDDVNVLGLLATYSLSRDQIGPLTGAGLNVPQDAPLVASELARFPWARWLGVTEQAAFSRLGKTVDTWGPLPPRNKQEERDQAKALRIAAKAAAKTLGRGSDRNRPGRKGHPPDHYERIAALYTQYKAAGERAPVQRIAREMNFSANTVQGWVNRCRDLGLLPTSSRGNRDGKARA